MDLVQALRSAADQGGSDVHILVGKPPMMRLNGEIRPIDPAFQVLSGEDAKGLDHGKVGVACWMKQPG